MSRDSRDVPLPWRYNVVARFFMRPLCLFRRHLQGSCGTCARCGQVCDNCAKTLNGWNQYGFGPYCSTCGHAKTMNALLLTAAPEIAAAWNDFLKGRRRA